MGRLSRWLVIGEVAMSVAMLVGSGLMIRSVLLLNTRDGRTRRTCSPRASR
jgi:hypothetical protein